MNTLKITLKTTTALIFIIFCLSPLKGYSQFIENKGQIGDSKGGPHPEVLYKSVLNDVTMFFKKDGIVYLFTKFETVPSEESVKERLQGNHTRASVLETKPMMFRMDMQFENTNPDVKVISSRKKEEVSNYYLPNCPEGILNVNHFEKITYKNLYENIDVDYYFTSEGLKYDIIVRPGGKISDIKFKYQGANEVSISGENKLQINYADGQKMVEETPVSYFENSKGSFEKISFTIDKTDGTIGFSGMSITYPQTLIIDPSITWATYFHNTNSANSSWTNTEYDASGNFFMANQTYDAAFPLCNPGGGAWYDAAHAYMIKVAVLKFNANRTLIWSTYYGGDKMNCLAGCTDYGKALALDNSGNVYVAGYTDPGTTVFPTQNPGGGAFYQDQSRCYGETSYVLKFNNNGVRQWASIFTHETASTSGTMMRINGITCDGTYLYFTGQQYNWTPANTIPLRNPGGGAHYQTTILGDQDVFVGRFVASTCVLNWCTYLHSTNLTNTAYGQGLDLHCDAGGNLFLTGRESGTNSHHYLINPGGGAFYQGTKGANGDLIITKFNTSLTAVWSTYYGGNGMDIPSTLEPDGAGNMYLVGRVSQSTDFPTLNPGGGALYQAAKSNAASDGFLIKFTASTCARTWATYLGATVPTAGSDENHFYGIACNTSNNHVFIMGDTPSTSIATLNKAGSYNQAVKGGGYDMFFYEFDNAGVTQWASYYGGSGNEQFYNGRIGSMADACGLKMVTHVTAATQTLGGVDPGNGAWYQGTTTFSWNDFLLELSDVSTPVTPTFSALGPYCVGSTPGTFSGTSTNGITGSWSPATISTASAGTATYTFTPTGGQCATTATMPVTVTANVTPTFSALGPYCQGATPGSLSGTSTNGITGTWSPATISTGSAG
ncbi:MAG TPA: SBBP repeat-containing protein, partial [Bacteroidales bacterium]|nr:SBBP repeat-containing protein [Bacteroidales bacterium]